MTKRELIVELSNSVNRTQREVAAVLQVTLDTIAEQLIAGNRLEIRNFGVFTVKTRNARVGRNPKTGAAIAVQRKQIPLFKPGKALRDAVERQPVATSVDADARDAG